ncbi:MerR family transcriptional regulator [Nonomuraea rubra]|uniref:MerR family transcriptional regulator n=1 Tax=Nonomuraea rubra TaxID=46180 RepID=UPI003614A4AF
MRIGELVRRTGVSERLLRYYEEQGLLHPSRLPSGYREYTEAHVETVRRIRCLLAAGLSTSTIATVLPCLEARGSGWRLHVRTWWGGSAGNANASTRRCAI